MNSKTFNLIFLILCHISFNQAFTTNFRLPFAFSEGESLNETNIDAFGTNDTIILLNSTGFPTLHQISNLTDEIISDKISLYSNNSDIIQDTAEKMLGLLPLNILSSNSAEEYFNASLNDLSNVTDTINATNNNDPLFIIPLMPDVSNLTIDDKISVNDSNPNGSLIPLWLSDINSAKEINGSKNIVYIDPLSLAEQLSEIYTNSTETLSE